MGGASYYTTDVMTTARDRLAAGEGVRAVARDMGLPVSTVSRWNQHAKRATSSGGVWPPPPPPPPPEPTEEPAWRPSGAGPVEDGLAIPQRATVDDWGALGRAYPPPGMGAERSSVVFSAIAAGIPLQVAAQRAGYAASEGDVWASRARDMPGWSAWWSALGMACAWAQVNLCARVMDGMAGWQGAARQLVAINPDVFNIKDQLAGIGGNSIEGVDNKTLYEMCARQMQRMDGQQPAVVVAADVLPLSETGMDEPADERRL